MNANENENKRISAASNFIVLIPSSSSRQMFANFLGVDYERLYIEIEEKKKKVFLLCSRPPQNLKLGTFTW